MLKKLVEMSLVVAGMFSSSYLLGFAVFLDTTTSVLDTPITLSIENFDLVNQYQRDQNEKYDRPKNRIVYCKSPSF